MITLDTNSHCVVNGHDYTIQLLFNYYSDEIEIYNISLMSEYNSNAVHSLSSN